MGPDIASEFYTSGLLVAPLDTPPWGWIGTRCAGPLDADVARALPELVLPLARAARGRHLFSIAGTRRFTGSGFTGTVDSTVELFLGRPRSALVSAPRGTDLEPQLATGATVRVLSVTGKVWVHASATPTSASCASLGACGQRTTIEITAGLRHNLQSAIYRARPSRGPVSGFFNWSDRGLVRATSLPGGCRDAVPLASPTVYITQHRKEFLLGYAPSSLAYDPLRTRCAGPVLGFRSLLRGTVAVNSLIRHTVRLHLSTPTAFSENGYRVTSSGSLTIRLRVSKLHTL